MKRRFQYVALKRNKTNFPLPTADTAVAPSSPLISTFPCPFLAQAGRVAAGKVYCSSAREGCGSGTDCSGCLCALCKQPATPPFRSGLGQAGIVQWLECWTRDWKVAGLNPCRSDGRIFFSRVDFLCWLLFRYPFHPRYRSRTWKIPVILPKCRWQVTANTHTPYVCSFALSDMVHGCMVYTELALRRLQFHGAPAMPAL